MAATLGHLYRSGVLNGEVVATGERDGWTWRRLYGMGDFTVYRLYGEAGAITESITDTPAATLMPLDGRTHVRVEGVDEPIELSTRSPYRVAPEAGFRLDAMDNRSEVLCVFHAADYHL